MSLQRRHQTSSTWLRAAAALLVLTGLAAPAARLTAAPASTPLLDWLFDRPVAATARVGNTLYVGGDFRNVSPVSAYTGHLVGVSAVTGALASGVPNVPAMVFAVEPDGSGGWFVARATEPLALSALVSSAVVHMRADGSIDPAFSASAITGTYRRLARVGPSLVVAPGTLAGFYGSLRVAGVERPLVALDPATGALSPWTPLLPGAAPQVLDLAVSGTTLFVLSRDGIFGAQRWVSAFDGGSGALLWQQDLGGTPAPGFPTFSGGALAVAEGRVIAGLDQRMAALNPATGAIDPAWGGANGAGVWVMDIEASGTAVYVGGRFTEFRGAARTNLAAVDLATGALTPWSPQFTYDAQILAVSPSGSVFVPVVGGTVDGQVRTRVAEIDAAGHVTPWQPDAAFSQTTMLKMTPVGTLVIGTSEPALAGAVPRKGLAAFDLTTGALLPPGPLVDGGLIGTIDATSVTGLVADGPTVYVSGVFTTVNGVARSGLAAVDTASNTVLAWAPPPVVLPSVAKIVLTSGTHVYIGLRDADPLHGTVRRHDAITGTLDAAWLPPPVTDLVVSDGRLVALRNAGGAAAVGELDGTTGQFIEWFRSSAVQLPATNDVFPFGGRLAVTGDTVYLAGPRAGAALSERATADTLLAFDRRTGMRVGPDVIGYINGLTVADGRVVAVGGGLTMNATQRLEIGEIERPGVFTAWTPAWPLLGAPVSFDYLPAFSFTRGAVAAAVAGDALVVRGRATGAPGVDRVSAFALSGNSVPANLRTQDVGGNTVFTWDAMVPPPPGGYVIEGGFAAGQTAGALPVGTATSVALPMPAGPVFIRVRPQGSASVSNEVVAGCVAPPLPPTGLTTTLSGINLTLAWTAPSGPVTGYTLLAGSAAGLSNVATLTLGPQTSVAGPVPGGTFFARVTASNACGTSGPSGEVFFTIGAADPLPAAPTNLSSNVSGSTLTLSWMAPAGPVTGYVLEAGTAPGLATIGAATIGAGTSFVIPGVPAGTYYVRVRAITSAGSGAPSTDVVVFVP